ncbi:DUF2752 domain-containing protein [Candidatus Saccharibacteria bacterium]|nr:DUF2752 domain-containing protein [Candidatus Saccharibacteria bacterium]
MEALGLQSPRGRLMVFTVLSVAVLLAPYEWLAHLSIWQALGIPSPSIGLTRAYHLLLHGDVAGAWQRNPLIFLVLAIGLPMLAFDAGRVFQQWRARHRPYPAKK